MSSDTPGGSGATPRTGAPQPSFRQPTLAAPLARIDGRRLTLRGAALFAGREHQARRLIDHAFMLDQVEAVALRRERNEISVELAHDADPGQVWRSLGSLIRQGAHHGPSRALRLDLDGPTPRLPVRIARAGTMLTTFRARVLSPEHLRIGHPQLGDRGIRSRFIELLRVVHGVSDVRAVGFRPVVIVTFDAGTIEAEQILRLVEGAWPEIAGRAPVAPAPRRLFVAGALLAFSFVAQFFRPLLLPWATAAVVLYSLPNVVGASRDLARGRIGLYALYTTGLGFLLWSRLPFASSVMAVFSQLWPTLARKLALASERDLFIGHRRRLAWARLMDHDRGEIIVGLDDLVPASLVVARAGDFVPADGIVVEGHALLDERVLNGIRGAIGKTPGDRVYAGTAVHDGSITVQVERTGPATAAAALMRALPQGALHGLPSGAEAERVANRNAKPALAVAAALLLATRVPRLSQVVIRPDYATAPRLSAHLSALTAMAEALSSGALIRRPAALELLPSTEAFVFDDGLDFGSRDIVLKKISALRQAAGEKALSLAAAALAGFDDLRSATLERELDDLALERTIPRARRQYAGKTVFWDEAGAAISVGSPVQALRDNAIVSPSQKTLIEALASHPAQQALVVARDNRIVGILQFAHQGRRRFAEAVSTLRAQYPAARFIHISERRQREAEADAEGLAFDAVFGDLDGGEKAALLRSLGLRTAWLGLGDKKATAVQAASTVSISLGGLERLPNDRADIVVLRDDLGVLGKLRTISDAHMGRLKADYRITYLANLTGIAGGFLAGFGSLEVGLVSNVGSALVFMRRWRRLATLSASCIQQSRTNIGTIDIRAMPYISSISSGKQ